MDLIGQEEKKQPSQSKKVITLLLIISVLILLLLIVIIAIILGKPKPKVFKMFIDEQPLETTQELIVTSEDGKKYVSLRDIAQKIGGFTYYYGDYSNKYIENRNYCYLENQNEIVGFESGSNIIYKTKQDSIIDYQYYELSSSIIATNEKLYILIEDLRISIWCKG